MSYHCGMIITVPLQIIDLHQDGYHPLVSVSVFGKAFTLVLDTGASKTAFDQEILSAEGINVMTSDTLSTGLGTNTMTSYTTILSDLYIGELKVSEFEVAVLDLSTINIAYRQLNHPGSFYQCSARYTTAGRQTDYESALTLKS